MNTFVCLLCLYLASTCLKTSWVEMDSDILERYTSVEKYHGLQARPPWYATQSGWFIAIVLKLVFSVHLLRLNICKRVVYSFLSSNNKKRI